MIGTFKAKGNDKKLQKNSPHDRKERKCLLHHHNSKSGGGRSTRLAERKEKEKIRPD
jgi:hypothetical protein